jgi:RHS repeat-associated protein
LQRRYIPGAAIDENIAMIDYTVSGNPKTFFHQDKTQSVVAMSDINGNITEGPYKYDAYGNGAPATGVPFKYTGQRYDPETGLYYYRARMYDPKTGRFPQTDSVGYKDDLNSYLYTHDDPTDNVDPSGNADNSADDPLAASPKDTDGNRAERNTTRRPHTTSLRKGWEKANNKSWPEDPKTGRPQQAAHIKARADGGDDSPGNIKPQPKDEHIQEHKDNGDFARWRARRGTESAKPSTGNSRTGSAASGSPTTKPSQTVGSRSGAPSARPEEGVDGRTPLGPNSSPQQVMQDEDEIFEEGLANPEE